MELQQLRPVGHRLSLNSSEFKTDLFSPFRFVGFASGTQALAAAITAVKNKSKGINRPNILVPAYTCPDVISACQYAGVEVKLVDFELDTCWMDIKDLENKLNKDSIAVIAINFLGIPERVELIRRSIGDSVVIIEDSAQGMAKQFNDCYWMGDLIVLSFGRGKPLNLFGGGALLFKDERWKSEIPEAEKSSSGFKPQMIYQLKRKIFSIISQPLLYFWLTRLPLLSIGETQFKPLEKLEEIPQGPSSLLNDAVVQYSIVDQNWQFYEQQLADLTTIQILSNKNEFSRLKSNLLRFPFLVQNTQQRDLLLEQLKNLGASAMYQKSLAEMDDLPAELTANWESYPNAKNFAERLITIPCHNDVSPSNQERIVSIIRDVVT